LNLESEKMQEKLSNINWDAINNVPTLIEEEVNAQFAGAGIKLKH